MKVVKKMVKQQKGFSVLSILLLMVGVITAISVWTMSGQTNVSNTNNSTADVLAASIFNDSSSIKLSFDSLVINGASPSKIVFMPPGTMTSSPNMLDVMYDIQLPKPNVNALKANSLAPHGMWIYAPNALSINNIGTNTSDRLAIIAGVKDSICKRINNTLYGLNSIPVSNIPSLEALLTDVTKENPTSSSSGFTLTNIADGWTSGCIAVSNGIVDHNFYYRVLHAN